MVRMNKIVEVQALPFHGWKGYQFSAGDLSLCIVPSIGGRILSLRFCKEELFFIQEEHAGETFDFDYVENLMAEKRKIGFRVWGGDKTWVAPQGKWKGNIPPIVLDAGKYDIEIQGRKIKMLSSLDRETGLRISREVEILASDRLELRQGLHNASNEVVKRGIWDVTQMLRDIYVCIPVPSMEIIPYPQEGKSKHYLSQVVSTPSEGWSCLTCDSDLHFKYGANPKQGRVITLKPCQKKNNFILMERIFKVEPEAQYAHKGSVEVYNSPTMNYSEVEVHAPLWEIPPGKSVYHNQTWYLQRIFSRKSPYDIMSKKTNSLLTVARNKQ